MNKVPYFSALVGILLSLAVANLVWTEPAPKAKTTIRLVQAGEMSFDELPGVEDAALIDEDRVVLVGTGAAIIDLAKKSARPLINEYKGQMQSVSVARGRIAITGDGRDPTLRIWDLKAGKTIRTIEIEKPSDQLRYYPVACFHKSNRIAVVIDEQIVMLDPAKPDEQIKLTPPPSARDLALKAAVSPDDSWLICTAGRAKIAAWEMATQKAVVFSLLPKWAEADGSHWSVSHVAFASPTSLIACRSWTEEGEVSKGNVKPDAPAERRGVVRIDLPEGRITPLSMGHTLHTLSCAIDPTGTWLATAGTSHLDQPQSDVKSGGELRIYHLPSGKLVFRTQPKGSLPLTWVAFTPSGKRIVCTTYNGVVYWWDVAAR